MRYFRKVPWRAALGGWLVVALALPCAAAEPPESPVHELTGLMEPQGLSVARRGKAPYLFLSGWMRPGQTRSDTIYFSRQEEGGWSRPEPAFIKPGYFLTSPAVVAHPHFDIFYLYYTMQRYPVLPESGTGEPIVQPKSIGLAIGQPCPGEKEKEHHGGREGERFGDEEGERLCWEDYTPRAPLIPIRNGVNGDGGYDASALLTKGEIWLYYHTDSPTTMLLRTRLNTNNTAIFGTNPVLVKEASVPGWPRPSEEEIAGRIAVTRLGDRYILLTDDKSDGMTRLQSRNGIYFEYVPDDEYSPFLLEEEAMLSSPALLPLSDNRYMLYTLAAAAPGLCRAALPCGRAVQSRQLEFPPMPKPPARK